MADGVDAAVDPDQSAAGDAPEDLQLTETELAQLVPRDYAVLAEGQLREGWRT